MIKQWLVCVFLSSIGMAAAQPFPFNGYLLYDYLETATHPSGCDASYVIGFPDDSTWVNMVDGSVMTGYFASTWTDQPGDDLLLETSYHPDNYTVRLILLGDTYSAPVAVDESMWMELAPIWWQHLFAFCTQGQATSNAYMLALDFGAFGIGFNEVVVGIEITFLSTVGAPDFAGAYIIIPPCEQLDLGPDTTICAGETIIIDATLPNATYVWQDGSTDPIYEDAGPGEYWVEITLDDCTFVETLNVLEENAQIELGTDTLLCTGQSLLLDVTTAGATYLWQDNTTQSTFTATQPGQYAVTVTYNDCLFFDDIEVSFTDVSDIDLGPDMTICGGSTLILDATTPGASYQWQDQSTGAQFEVMEPGAYSVSVNVAGCTGFDEINIDYFYPGPVDLGPDIALCLDGELYLDAFTPNATYVWQDNYDASGFTVTSPGIYAVTVTVDGCTTSDEITVSAAPLIEVDLGPDTELCIGESFWLDAYTPDATYTWQDNSTNETLLVTEAGQYSVTITVDGCTAADTMDIQYVTLPTIYLGNDTTLCSEETITLDAQSTGATYVWQDNSTGPTYAATQTGTYWVVVSYQDCTISDTIQINFNTLAPITLGQDTTLCAGSTLLLDAGPSNASLQWQDQSTGSTLLVTAPGTYWVTAQEGDCSIADTIAVDYLSAVSVDLGNDTTICSDQPFILDATIAGGSYAWQDQSTASTYNVTQSGNYWVEVSIGNCMVSDTIIIDHVVIQIPDLGQDTILCADETLVLDANTPGTSYQWNDNSLADTLIVTAPGQYWVISTMNGCMAADTIDVGYVILPAVNLGPDTTFCNAQSFLLDASTAGASYTWQDQSIASTFSVTQPGNYWVEVNLGGCLVSDTIAIDYILIPALDLGADTFLCVGETLLLDADTDGATYQWQDNSTDQEFLATLPGTYSVIVSIGDCATGDTIQVGYHVPIPIDLGNDTTLCDGQSILLNVLTSGASYLWQDQSTQPDFLVTMPGEYYVLVSDGLCVSRDSIYVAYLNINSVNLGADTTLCSDQELILQPDAPGAQYLWQDNSTNPTFTVMDPGLYWVQVIVGACSVADSIEVEIANPVLVDLGMDTLLCPGASLLLDATTANASYEWNDLSNLPGILVSQPGSYWVIVDVMGCKATDTISVDHFILPQLFLGNDTILCDGDLLLLDVTYAQATYTWQDQSTNPTYLVSEPGTYAVQMNMNNCVAGDTIQVDYIMPVAWDLGPDQTICDGDKLLLDPGLDPTFEFRWQDESTANTYVVDEGGQYWLNVKDDCGTTSDSITISVDPCQCDIYFPNIFTPDGDNLNDMVMPVASCDLLFSHLQIYDRFGGLLFETKDVTIGWDGTSTSKLAQSGVYVYLLVYSFEDGEQRYMTGDVTLLR